LDVEYRLLAEEVVDPQDLILGQELVQFVVEGSRGVEVVAEGFLDHHGGLRE
jgi:hypothetical protein